MSMRYVSSIRNSSGRQVDAFEYPLSDCYKYNLSYATLDDGLNITVGRGTDYVNSLGVVVRHTAFQAALHRHINVLDTRSCMTPLRYRQADRANFTTGELIKGNNSIIEIAFPNDTVLTYGTVCSWESRGVDGRRLCTLYDVLAKLCRCFRLNVMAYETIQLGSAKNLWQTTIRLLHNREADCFYTKMYLAVLNGL